MKVFVFGIGGTGSRVLRSLTMLLASGIKLKGENITIVPIIIDTDSHNGDTERTRDLLRWYYSIRRDFVSQGTTSLSDTFFNTPIKSFNKIEENEEDSTELDIQFGFQNKNQTFADFIGHIHLNQINKDLLELFFNDSLDEHPELYLNLNVGFKGNPNIGSVVFNDLKNSAQFKNLENSFPANDRIFIISSIFGGTGSSGFPTLVKLFRNSKNPNLKKAKIGAITVMPYFNVDSKENSVIKSSLFDTKTKAALDFYSEDKDLKSINALYYISDNKQSGGSLPYAEGDKEQKNSAHLVELLSATAIIDFINKEDKDLKNNQFQKNGSDKYWEEGKCYEFGADTSPLKIADLTRTTKERYFEALTRFAFSSKIALDFIPTLSKTSFYKLLDIGNKLGVSAAYDDLLKFFASFQAWSSKELGDENHNRAFKLFEFDHEKEHLNNIVTGKVIKTSPINTGLQKETIRGTNISELLSKSAVKEIESLPKPVKYMNSLYKTAFDCFNKLESLP